MRMGYLFNRIVSFVGNIINKTLAYTGFYKIPLVSPMPDINVDINPPKPALKPTIKFVTKPLPKPIPMLTENPKPLLNYFTLTTDILNKITTNKITVTEFIRILDDIKKPEFLLNKSELEQVVKIDKEIFKIQKLIHQADKEYDRAGSAELSIELMDLQRERNKILRIGRLKCT